MPFDPKRFELFPTSPGVYLMKDKGGNVLYVGKAKNLRSRLRQYFLPGGDGRVMVPYLISKVHDIDTLVVFSEKEALLVENNLIKEYLPKYNALLKDDKTYIALKVTLRNPWPTVELVRYRGKPEGDGLYFGPYTSAHSARGTLDLLHRIFPLRQCSNQEFARRTRPCILYGMKRCIAPCVGKCSKEEYDHLVDRTVRFLKGHDKIVLQELYQEMEKASETLEFEKAALFLQTIRQIEKTIEAQTVDKPLGVDSDVLGSFRKGEEVVLSQLFIRQGKLMGSRHYDFQNIGEDDVDLLKNFILQYYAKAEEVPHEIIIPIEIDDAEALSEVVSSGKKRTTAILTPQRGEKRKLSEMALANAEAQFKKSKDEEAIRERILLEMQEKFHLNNYPHRIECFDNSNISGEEPVSVMIAFTEGVKDKNRYRKYKVRSVEGPDDYATMMEVLERRLRRGKEEGDLPDLLVVDGGKGHLNVALRVLGELNIITVDVISIAKEQGRHDKGITSEQVFLPNVKDPILLRTTSPILFLLQQIRDEAHRFAITFHRKRRSKGLIKSSLADLPGIGPVKQKLLLRHFGSVKKLSSASEEDLKQVKGLNKKDIEILKNLAKKKSAE